MGNNNTSELEKNIYQNEFVSNQTCKHCGKEVEVNKDKYFCGKYICPYCYKENITKKEKIEKLDIDKQLSLTMKILCFFLPFIGIICSIIYFFKNENNKSGTAALCAVGGIIFGQFLRIGCSK